MESEVISRIFKDRQELFSLPQTLVEVLRLAEDEMSGADDLSHVIMKDPSLTARILRIVNSAYYGAVREISDIKQAVVMLGMHQVTALALSSSVYSLTSRWETSLDLVRFWRHSLEVAIASRLIAKATGQAKADELFVAGLLHDIGLLIMEKSFAREFQQVWKRVQSGEELIDVEEEVWGTDHAKVGRFLLEQWRLPETICAAVGMHHATFVPGANDPELIPAQVVALANRISRFSIGERMEWRISLKSEDRKIVQANLGLSEECLLGVEKELFSRTISEARFLEMEIGTGEEILTEANRILFEQYVTVENLLQENRQMQQEVMRDKYGRLSLDSLRTTTRQFARHVETAADVVGGNLNRLQQLVPELVAAEKSAEFRSVTSGMTEALRAIYGITSEMKNYAVLDEQDLADEERRAELEENMKLHLERSCPVA